MIAACAAPFILGQQGRDIQLIYHLVYYFHQMPFRNQFFQARWQQALLVHAVRFEGYFSVVHAPIVLNFPLFEEGAAYPFLDNPPILIQYCHASKVHRERARTGYV